MTDESALLAAICAAPADDEPRLVYADLLEEHGRLPMGIFRRIPYHHDEKAADEVHDTTRTFPSSYLAIAALSTACVRYGRELQRKGANAAQEVSRENAQG